MSQAVPDHYYWTPVQLLDHEVSAIAVLVEMVLKENPRGFPYSLVYSPDALDITGRLRSGAGFTCATYVVALFDTLKIPFLATKTWKARPEEDQAFKDQYLEGNYFDPIRRGMAPFISDAAAARIQFETPDFRVKPGEVCGAATAKNYPVNFTQAVQRAKQVAERIEELQKEATSNLPSNSS